MNYPTIALLNSPENWREATRQAFWIKGKDNKRTFCLLHKLKRIIQQFVVDIITEGYISGKRLAKNLEEKWQIVLSPRSILHHVSKLGLRDIRSSFTSKANDGTSYQSI